MNDNRPTEETLDYAERWLRDGLEVLRPAFSALQTTVDMTNATSRLDRLRRQGVQATATHLLVQATARALRSNPRLHQVVGYKLKGSWALIRTRGFGGSAPNG